MIAQSVISILKVPLTISTTGARAQLTSMPTNRPKNTPARALNFFFGVIISNKRTNTAIPILLKMIARKFALYVSVEESPCSSLSIIGELILTNTIATIITRKIALKIHNSFIFITLKIMINIRFYKCSHYILLTKRFQSIYYISSHFISTILKTGSPDRNRQVTKKALPV